MSKVDLTTKVLKEIKPIIRCRDCVNSTKTFPSGRRYYHCSKGKGTFPAASTFEECNKFDPIKKEEEKE